MNAPPSAGTHWHRLALAVRLLTALGALLMASLPALLLFSDEGVWNVGASGFLGMMAPGPGTAARWRAAGVSLLPVAAMLYVLWQLWALFGEYAQGRVFGTAALQRLRRFARGLLVLALLQPATRALMSVALTLDNPPGQRMLMVSLGWHDYIGILMAAVLLAIAQVMAQAARLAEDNAGFV